MPSRDPTPLERGPDSTDPSSTATAAVEEAGPRTEGLWEFEVAGEYYKLTNDYDDWRSTRFLVKRNFDPKGRSGVLLELLESERFGFIDRKVVGGFSLPIWLPGLQVANLHIEGGYTADAEVLPEWTFQAQMSRDAPVFGWIPWLGWQHRRYATASNAEVNVIFAGLEKYMDAYRFSGTLYSGNLRTDRDPDNAWTWTQSYQVDRYYGDENYVRIGYTRGEEQENIPQVLSRIATSNIQNSFLQGVHFIGRRWALAYLLKYQEQGDFYERYGGSLGLRLVY